MPSSGDLSENAVETAPACHFWNGGHPHRRMVPHDRRGAVGGGGGLALIHGANRLSGNALTMTQVFGPRAGRSAARPCEGRLARAVDPDQVEGLRAKVYQFLGRKGAEPDQLRTRLRRLAHLNAGPVREDETTIEGALDAGGRHEARSGPSWAPRSTRAIYNQEWVECMQIENMLQCLELVLSRASHPDGEPRRGVPPRLPRHQQPGLVQEHRDRQADGQPTYDVRPVNVTSLTPPSDDPPVRAEAFTPAQTAQSQGA